MKYMENLTQHADQMSVSDDKLHIRKGKRKTEGTKQPADDNDNRLAAALVLVSRSTHLM